MNTNELVTWIKGLIEENNVHLFYISKTIWKPKRQSILKRDNNECQICKERGEYTAADTVHHIKPLREHQELALTDSNLISVCDSCHYDIHHRIENKTQLNEEKW